MNKYIEFTVIAGVFLLLLGAAFAASSQEAIDFVSKQNNFLTENETAGVYPDVKIRNSGKYFFVVTVLSTDSSLAGFIPVSDAEPMQLPESLVARRELIKTAYVLRYYLQLEKSVGDSTQKSYWLFNADTAKYFSDLAQDLKNERIDLVTVKSNLEGFPELQNKTDALKNQLDEMFPLAEDISAAVLDATYSKENFVANPDTNKLKDFERKFQTVFDLIESIDSKRSIYLEGEKKSSSDTCSNIVSLDCLRQGIGETTLSIETIRSLNTLANISQNFQNFSSIASLSTRLKERINQIFSKVDSPSFITGLTDDLTTREKRNSAFQVLYGQSDELMKKTGQQTLSNLVDFILQDDYVFKWIKQGSVTEMQSNWAKAETFYGNGSFDDAERYAGTAKEDALRVYEGGLEEDGQFDTDLLFTGIILLIIVLIVLFIIKNRKKLFKLIAAKQEQEQEVQIYDFEK